MNDLDEAWVIDAPDVDAAVDEPAPPADAPDEVDLYYDTLDEFVREYLIKVYRRPIDGDKRIWKARWWEYPEAVIRLSALWRSWEAMRLDPATGISDWYRLHADHHMPILMEPHGPFAGKDDHDEANTSRVGADLPYEAPPASLRIG